MDNGENWSQKNNGLTIQEIYCLERNSIDHIFAGTNDGIYRSTDNGENWIQINNGLTDLDVNCLAVNSSGNIFAGTDDGVFHSADNGENWIQINNGLTDLDVNCLEMNSDGYVLAGTDNGVFRSINTTTSVEIEYSIPSMFTLYQNYPNPFNPSTNIVYSISSQRYVTLKVFDVLGREVTTLVNENQSVGNYEVKFDASELTSGIYFYRIQAGDFVETKKMVLMK